MGTIEIYGPSDLKWLPFRCGFAWNSLTGMAVLGKINEYGRQ